MVSRTVPSLCSAKQKLTTLITEFSPPHAEGGSAQNRTGRSADFSRQSKQWQEGCCKKMKKKSTEVTFRARAAMIQAMFVDNV